MITKDYNGSNITPTLEAARALKDGTSVPEQIRVTREWLHSQDFTNAEKSILEANVSRQAICPPLCWFNVNKETRRILLGEK